MKDEMKEKLSAFMDGELKDDSFVGYLAEDQEARDVWARYHIIKDVLNHQYSAGASRLSARISAQLDNEATVIRPKRWFRPSVAVKQIAGLAVAATVATVAILVVQSPQPVSTVGPIVISPITDKPIRLTAEVERKLSGYLVSHNEFSASTRMKGMLPYTRIVSPVPGQLITYKPGAKNID